MFRASIPGTGPLSESQASKAQQALAAAVAAFVGSGAAGDRRLVKEFAQKLDPPNRDPASVLAVNLDDNSLLDLIVGVPLPRLEPLLSLNGQPPRPLLPATGTSVGATTRVVEARDFAGDSRPFVVLTRAVDGASATTTDVLIVAFVSGRPEVVFDQQISDWAGPASWRIAQDQSVELTCPAFGIYDHKLLKHPRQVRSYRWDGATFALASRHTDPPTTRREMINLAEADFLDGDLAGAATRFRAVVDNASLADEEGVQVDWRNVARFRLGEIAALSGQQAEAEKWLTAAAQAQPPLGAIAGAFLQAERSGGPAAGFAAIQQSDLPDLFERSQMGNLDFPIRLGPFAALGQGVAFVLNHSSDPSNISASGLSARISQAGLQAKNVTVGDLNGDGQPEIAMILPFGHREQTLWLVVRQSGGWRALATVEALDGVDGLHRLSEGRQAIGILAPRGSARPTTLLVWDGQQVGLIASPTSTVAPAPTNFVAGDGTCQVAEDLGSG